jgi:hypothetical protein
MGRLTPALSPTVTVELRLERDLILTRSTSVGRGFERRYIESVASARVAGKRFHR